MKDAKYSKEKIISAGNTLAEAGKPVTGYAIRKIVGGGNAARIKNIWEEYLKERGTEGNLVNISDIELPAELTEFVDQLNITFYKLSVKAYQIAIVSGETQITELNRVANDVKNQAMAELADASKAVDEAEEIAEKSLHKIHELETNLKALSLKKSEISGELKSESNLRKEMEKRFDQLIEQNDSVKKERDIAIGKSEILNSEVKKLQKQLTQATFKTDKYCKENSSLQKMLEATMLTDEKNDGPKAAST